MVFAEFLKQIKDKKIENEFRLNYTAFELYKINKLKGKGKAFLKAIENMNIDKIRPEKIYTYANPVKVNISKLTKKDRITHTHNLKCTGIGAM